MNWSEFKNDDEVLEYLRSLPRYNNTPIKSLLNRASTFLYILYIRLFRLLRPIIIVLVTNNRCNADCVYCYGNYGQKKQYKEYTTRQLLEMIDELRKMGTKLLIMHGGESLLRDDIGEILNYAKLKKFYVSLNTNGYLVPQKIKELSCIDTVCISLDGREANNDKYRGKGSYKKAVKAIDVLFENRIPCLIHSTLTEGNSDDVEFLSELAMSKNCRLQFSILYNSDEAKGKDISLSDEKMKETIAKIYEVKKGGGPVYYSDNVLKAAINWPDTNKYFFAGNDEIKDKTNLIPCYHGRLKFQIDADGRVVTCWAHNNPDAPNVNELGVKEAIRQCHDRNVCKYCAFLANNEQNALMDLGLKNVLHMVIVHIFDSLKLNKLKGEK